MTHEYVIALNGRVEPDLSGSGEATAIGWAADAVLAVGPDAIVRAISRGDSTFLDLQGCVVTPLPLDLQDAAEVVRRSAPRTSDIDSVLVEAELLDSGAALEPGAPADFAIWDLRDPARPKLKAVVRGGHFTEGDEHRGPFPAPRQPPSASERD
jgi:hypothetical protein